MLRPLALLLVVGVVAASYSCARGLETYRVNRNLAVPYEILRDERGSTLLIGLSSSVTE